MLQATRSSTTRSFKICLVSLHSETCRSNLKMWVASFSFPLSSSLSSQANSTQAYGARHTLSNAKCSKFINYRPAGRGHAGSNTAAVQSKSVTDKRCPNFLEGTPQKALMHLLPAYLPHSETPEIALKWTGKPELTREPFPTVLVIPWAGGALFILEGCCHILLTDTCNSTTRNSKCSLLLATYLFISFFYASLPFSKNPFQAIEILSDFKSDEILNK